ncbi:MAG TPA: oligosaccharide flippase family protein [Anaerolineales bacterium]|nr:oligosaccharide flippase family protein [Anaerolineales bacterium]
MSPDPGAGYIAEPTFTENSIARTSRLGRNALWLLLGRIANHLILILVTILIARGMGDVVLGQYAFVTSLLFLFNGISTLGTDTLLVREIAARNNFSVFWPSLTIQLGISLLIIILVYWFGPLFQSQSADGALALKIYTWSLFPLAIFTVVGAALRGKEEMGTYSLISTSYALLQLIAVAFLVSRNAGIVGMVAVLLGMNLLGAIVAVVAAMTRLPSLRAFWEIRSLSIPRVLRAGAAIALFGILATAYQRTSLYFVGFLQDAASTGSFAAAARIVEAPKFIHVAVLSALLPSMSATFSKPNMATADNRAVRTYRISLIGLILFSTVSSMLIYGFADPLIRMLFGYQFTPAVLPLKIIAWALVPFAVSQYFAVRLLAEKREKQVIMALAIGIAALSLLCFFSIPMFGITGASWSALIAEIILAITVVGFAFASK